MQTVEILMNTIEKVESGFNFTKKGNMEMGKRK